METIRYGSVCSGIEAATVAWESLGWNAAWFAEIEPFPSAVLAHHYPEIANHGDMTKLAKKVLAGEIEAPDVLVGGPPCQAFSIAGMREGLNDPRGQLIIKYVELADAIDYVRTRRGLQPAIAVWENVPGVLSDKENAFGCFLGALSGEDCELQPPRGKWTNAGCVFGPKRTVVWRILDAQYFGLAQRRRRVFVVASARKDTHPAQILFEFEGMRRDSAPSRKQGQDIAAGTLRSTDGGSDVDRWRVGESVSTVKWPADLACTLNASFGEKLGLEDQHINSGAPLFVPHMLTSGQSNAQHSIDIAGALTCLNEPPIVIHGTQDPDTLTEMAHTLGRNHGQENAVLAFSCKDHGADAGELSPTLRAMGHGNSHANAGGQVAVCVTGDITHTLKAEGFDASEDGTGRGQPIVAACRDIAQTITSNYGKQCDSSDTALGPNVAISEIQVRRLTPRECERLQGFPDDYTLIPWRIWQQSQRGKSSYEALLASAGLKLREPTTDDCPDGPRYKAIGNSMAVQCMGFIGRRIDRFIKRTSDALP